MVVLNPTAPSMPYKPFIDIVACSTTPSTLVKLSTLQRGEPTVHFSAAEVLSMAKPFKLSLIGKFSFDHPPMDVIRKVFSSLSLKRSTSFFVRQ